MISLKFHNLLGCGWDWNLLLPTSATAKEQHGEMLAREPFRLKATPAPCGAPGQAGPGSSGHGIAVCAEIGAKAQLQ